MKRDRITRGLLAEPKVQCRAGSRAGLGLNIMILRPWPSAEIKSRSLKPLSHPRAPVIHIFVISFLLRDQNSTVRKSFPSLT